MDIHKKINYRSWVIEKLLINGWPDDKIQWFRNQMLVDEDLKRWAKAHLYYTPRKGRVAYYKCHLYCQQRISLLKRLGFNYNGKQIGFGDGVIVK